MKNLILGVDIGTSSVKLVILNRESQQIEYEASYSTSKAKLRSQNSTYDEQDVAIILDIVNKAFDCIHEHLLPQIQAIQICGQMHGVVLWNKTTRVHSNLITWQDERCDEKFLNSLPVKSKSDVSSGYGCATLYWLSFNNQLKPEFDSAGTIHDFLTFLLAGHNVMSDQNALSWGYFDLNKNEWQNELFNCDTFPSYLLPKTAKAGYKLSDFVTLLNSVRLEAKIFNALGDLQSSVLSSLQQQTDCVINISTSAQICVPIDTGLVNSIDLAKSVTCFPFFEDKLLLVSASLNGGNVLEKFVDMLIEWNKNLGVDVSRDMIWKKLLEQDENLITPVVAKPLLFAERHDRLTYGSLCNLRQDNLSIVHVFKSMCLGLVRNLHSMMGRDLISRLKCERIVATGGALTRNSVLRTCLESEFDYLPIVYASATDAAYGSAIFLMQLLEES